MRKNQLGFSPILTLIIVVIIIVVLLRLVSSKIGEKPLVNKVQNENTVIFKTTPADTQGDEKINTECAIKADIEGYSDYDCSRFEYSALSKNRVFNELRIKQIKQSGAYFAILAEPLSYAADPALSSAAPIKTIIGTVDNLEIFLETGYDVNYIKKFEFLQKDEALILNISNGAQVSTNYLISSDNLKQIEIVDEGAVIPENERRMLLNNGTINGDYEIVDGYLEIKDQRDNGTTTVLVGPKSGLVLSYKVT